MDTAATPVTKPQYRPLPEPSKLTLPGVPLPNPPPSFVIRFVLRLRRFLLRLADALCPADLVLFDQLTGIASTALLGAVARHGIADFLEERGAAPADAIANALGLNADAVHRTLRALSNMGIFAMSDAGDFSNNRVSRALRSGLASRSREWAIYFSSGSNSAAWLDFARTLETGESAFTRLHGMNVWQWFDEHPDEREMFAHAMMGLTVMDAAVVAGLYPFAEVRRLCDVGGGRGTLISEIVKRHPHVRGVLCDGEGVIASARELLARRGVADRVELVASNFFEKVPSGCDAYLMKNILHDWDDAAAVDLLRVVRRAMEPGGRVLLCELLLEKCSRDGLGTRADLQMMVACDNGRERGLDELCALLSSSGFRYKRVFRFPTLGIVEGEAI